MKIDCLISLNLSSMGAAIDLINKSMTSYHLLLWFVLST